MIANKPSIYIYVHEPAPWCLQEICAGIEEEGLLFDIVSQTETDARILASQAAKESALDTGIGISRNRAAFTLGSLSPEKPVSYYEIPQRTECRNMGINAARAVKRMPFRI